MVDQIRPHGGTLRHPIVDPECAERLKAESADFPSISLTQRQLCDLELLLNGAFSPLSGFMDQAAYDSVVEKSRLTDGLLWPIPVVLDVSEPLAEKLDRGRKVALRDNEGFMLAVLTVRDVWKPDRQREADLVYGTTSTQHAGVRYLLEEVQSAYVGGEIEGIQLPTHYDYEELRHTPEELRHLFAKLGWRRVVAYHTSHPMHRLEREISMRAAKDAQAHILLHPIVGLTKPGNLSYFARVKCYQAIQHHYPHGLTTLSLLPLALRMAGPREALWHCLIRQNYGCSHLIVGSNRGSPPAGPGSSERFYPEYSAQNLIAEYQDELDIEMVPVKRMCYSATRGQFMDADKATPADDPRELFPESEIARRLACGENIPSWFTYPEVLQALRQVHPPRSKQGITLFFTGLSGSGKSTLAKIMYGKFVEAGKRPVTLLDGDIVRQNLSSELGFSKKHRNLNVRRIGFVASEITKNGGVAICAPIAPYEATRRAVRELIASNGAMIEIHVSTPLEVCEERDRKGLYVKARKGIIPEFTGISDPYEVPQNPELRIDTTHLAPMQAAQEIYLYLLREGYIDSEEGQTIIA